MLVLKNKLHYFLWFSLSQVIIVSWSRWEIYLGSSAFFIVTFVLFFFPSKFNFFKINFFYVVLYWVILAIWWWQPHLILLIFYFLKYYFYFNFILLYFYSCFHDVHSWYFFFCSLKYNVFWQLLSINFYTAKKINPAQEKPGPTNLIHSQWMIGENFLEGAVEAVSLPSKRFIGLRLTSPDSKNLATSISNYIQDIHAQQGFDGKRWPKFEPGLIANTKRPWRLKACRESSCGMHSD